MELKDASRLIATPLLHGTVATTWADLGCGSGVFTNALATHQAPGSTIVAVDFKNTLQLNEIPSGITIRFTKMDFDTGATSLPALDGILMANALHFVAGQPRLLQTLCGKLAPGSLFILVEYDITVANRRVPYPVPFEKANVLFRASGFSNIVKVREYPSVYHQAKIYSCIARVADR